ncbi:MAG: hypothetical protein ACYC4T_11380 [Melioribacteraceae bacterium]
MSLLRLILWATIFYLIFNTARNVLRFLSSNKSQKDPNEVKQKKQGKYKIENEDVIDAHFEEIDQEKSDKQKENS